MKREKMNTHAQKNDIYDLNSLISFLQLHMNTSYMAVPSSFKKDKKWQ